MARSSTTYRPKWNLGKTTVIRVPQALAQAALRYARDLDHKAKPSALPEPPADGRTSKALEATNPRNLSSVLHIAGKSRNHRLRCNIRAAFATALKNWRLRENIPLKKLAADLGLTVATISMWELGQRFPTGPHFEKLVEYTDVPPCRLFCVVADKCVPGECLLALPTKP